MEVERFYIDDKEVDQSEFELELENQFTEDFEANYDEYLDECFPEPVKVAGYTFTTSFALKQLDPDAYREMFLNDANAQFTEQLDEIYRQVEWDGEYNGMSFRYEWFDEGEEEEPEE